jgi:hypothetical protein
MYASQPAGLLAAAACCWLLPAAACRTAAGFWLFPKGCAGRNDLSELVE